MTIRHHPRRGEIPDVSSFLTESSAATITGNWTFSGTLAVPAATVTAHEAALTILESQITDGSILARVASIETISAAWTFSAIPDFNAGLDVHGGNELRIYDSTGSDHVDMFHNGTDLRINTTNTRWWSVRGSNIFQLDADSAGTSPIPSFHSSKTLDHGMCVTSTTSGDILGFQVYNADGTNNPRAAFYMDDTDAEWGLAMTWSSGAAMDFAIRVAGTQYFGVDHAYNDTGRGCVASALDHSANLRQLGFNDLKRQRANNISFTMAAEDAGSVQYYTTASNTITTEANTTQDFPIGAVLTIINRSSGTQSVAAGTGVTIYKFIGSSSSGTATIGAYSVACVYRYDASNFFVWGTSVT